MTDQLIEELRKAVTENLPALAAGQMQKYITLAEKDKERLEWYQGQVAELEKLEGLTSQVKTLGDRNKFLEGAAANVIQRELTLDKTILEIKLACAEGRNTDVLALVQKVFGHPSVTVTTSNRGIPISGTDTLMGLPGTTGLDEIEKKVETKD